MTQSRTTVIFYWFILAIVIFFYGFESLLRSAPDSLSKLGYGLSNGLSGNEKDSITGLIKSYYYFSYVPLQLIAGPMVDRYGVRHVLIASTLLLFIGLILSGFASPSYSYLIYTGRFLIGAGSAFAFVCVITTATYLVPNDINFASGLSSGVGLLFASYIGVEVIQIINSIQSFFILSIVICMILLILILMFVKIPKARQESIQCWPQILKAYLHLFKSLNIWVIGIIGAILFLPIILFSDFGNNVIPMLFQYEGTSQEVSDFIKIMKSTLAVGFIVGSPLIGFLSKNHDRARLMITFSCLLSCIVFSLFTFHIIPGFIAQGFMVFVLGLLISAEILVFPLASSTVPSNLTGSAVACANFFVMIPGLLGQTIQTRLAEASSDNTFILIMPIILLLAFLMSFFIKSNKGTQSATTN